MSFSAVPITPNATHKKLLCFGFGYTAFFLSTVLRQFDWQIAGTTMDEEKQQDMEREGIDAHLFQDNYHTIFDPQDAFDGVTHILLSIPPNASGDPVFHIHGNDFLNIPTLEWVGYLSATSVYGNHDGNWVDEDTPPSPTSQRGSRRLLAEEQWETLCYQAGLPLHIFRLSGIYGPGRSALDTVLGGHARRISKEGQVFNRIYIEDIVQTLIASINMPMPSEIYNVGDDMPSASHEVINYACHLLNVEAPELIPFEQTDLAPMVRSFYKDNKRINNTKIKQELGVDLMFPNYQVGLEACLKVLKENSPELLP